MFFGNYLGRLGTLARPAAASNTGRCVRYRAATRGDPAYQKTEIGYRPRNLRYGTLQIEPSLAVRFCSGEKNERGQYF